MRIGFVTGEFPPMEGGVGAFTMELSRSLSDLNHKVYVFTRASVTERNDSVISITPTVGANWGWSTIPSITEWARRCELDLVNIQMQAAAFNMHPSIYWLPSVIQRTTPVVVTFHDLRVPYLFPKAGKIREWIVRKQACDASGVIATDRQDANETVQWGVQKAAWIPIGSNVKCQPTAGFDRATFRQRLGIDNDQLLLSYFGFLNESKGPLYLVEALAALVAQGVKVTLVMIGGRTGASDRSNNSYGVRVDASIIAHGVADHVIPTGFVSDHEVSDYFLASDICVLPYLDGASLRRGTLMAALQHGRAIVTSTPESSSPELEGIAEFVPVGDSDAIAKQVLNLWRNPVRRKQLEAAALSKAGEFAWDGIAARTVTFYKVVLNER